MSVVTSSPQQICNSPLNNSTAKMLYSFPKAPRSTIENKNVCGQAFYDLPPVRESRAASFGYGRKYDFTQGKANYPAPNAYQVRREIEKSPKRGFSFGLSREVMAITGGHYVGDKTSPGPGAYDVRETNKTSLSYSFRPRTNLAESQSTTKIVPGPGAYPTPETISPNGKLFISKYHSAATTVFSPAQSKRFDGKKLDDKPGPGAYNLVGELSPKGSYFLSKFHSSLGKTFGLSLRNKSPGESFKEKIPGPGSYKLPSDFGHYESKSVAKPASKE